MRRSFASAHFLRWRFGVITLVVLVAFNSAATAENKPQVLDLWPGKAPGEKQDIGEEKVEEITKGELPFKRIGNVSKPTLTIYRPAAEKNTGVAVLIAPGGGYNILAFDKEGEEVAKWLSELGVTGVVLKYRVPRRKDQPQDKPPIGALQDAQRAMGLIRSKAEEWKVDSKKVGMLGFSAGGHLTAWVSTNYEKRAYDPKEEVDKQNCRPDFGILIYPGGLLVRGKTDVLSPEIQVTPETPPMFMAQASDDPVNAENSVAMYLALKKAKVPAEIHLYATGGHGFGMRPSDNPCSTWPARCEEWMRSQGILPKKGTK